MASTTITLPRLQAKFREEVQPAMMTEHGISNRLAAPDLSKIVVSMGVGEARENKGVLDAAMADLAVLTGQKPAMSKARKSVSNFKLRQGMPIGCHVTLRGVRMWEFLDRLISVVIPRIKDFRGLRRRLDGRGNYSLGLSDQTVFPEIDLDKMKHNQGMNVTLVTTASSDELGLDLLRRLGLPFERDDAEGSRN